MRQLFLVDQNLTTQKVFQSSLAEEGIEVDHQRPAHRRGRARRPVLRPLPVRRRGRPVTAAPVDQAAVPRSHLAVIFAGLATLPIEQCIAR